MITTLGDDSVVMDWSEPVGHDCRVSIGSWDSKLRVIRHEHGDACPMSLMDVGDWFLQSLDPAVRAWRKRLPQALDEALSQLPSRQASLLAWAVESEPVRDLLISNAVLLWQLVDRGLLSDRSLEEVGQLLRVKQKTLCAQLGLSGSSQQVRLLKIAALGQLTARDIRVLFRVLDNKEVCDFLSHRGTISSFDLHLIDQFSWLVVHPVRVLIDELREPRNFALFNSVHRLLIFDDYESLFRCTSIQALRRLHDDLQADMANYRDFSLRLDNDGEVQRLPPPPIPGADGIYPLQSQQEIIEEGEEMNHCIATYIDRVLRGEFFVYQMIYPERLTIGVKMVADGSSGRSGVCLLREVRGRCNRHPTVAAMTLIERWFESFVPRDV